jgi:16S rRNA (uracil1498-N3)-methyltransferase
LAAVVAARSEEEGGITLAIGPEGGFSAQEEAELLRAGFVPAALSLQILRGETAALAALAIAAHSIDF